MPLLFALITETALVTPAELFRLCVPLELNARHCAVSWGLEPPAVVVIDARAKLPARCQPVVFLDSEGEDADALAVHYVDPALRGPAARVYCDRASGFRHGRYSICEAAAHEVVEALVDPFLNLWTDHPDPDRARLGVQVAVEVADPVQTTYALQHAGDTWPVANYVTPDWHRGRLYDPETRARFLTAGGLFDHSGELQAPGQVGPEGYAVLRSPKGDGFGWRTWSEARVPRAADVAPAQRVAKAHPWSRTRRRGGA